MERWMNLKSDCESEEIKEQMKKMITKTFHTNFAILKVNVNDEIGWKFLTGMQFDLYYEIGGCEVTWIKISLLK